MTTRELLNKLYGTTTFDRDDPLGVTAIGTTATKFADNDPQAVQLTVINTGATDINIWTDPSVSTSKGIRVAANGGSYEIDFTRFGTYPTREWWAIGVGGSSTISTKRLIASSQ